eukprot:980739-Prorocentrum_minimum.AAC.2
MDLVAGSLVWGQQNPTWNVPHSGAYLRLQEREERAERLASRGERSLDPYYNHLFMEGGDGPSGDGPNMNLWEPTGHRFAHEHAPGGHSYGGGLGPIEDARPLERPPVPTTRRQAPRAHSRDSTPGTPHHQVRTSSRFHARHTCTTHRGHARH